jgi:preprotein translocase subunit SecG
MYQVLLVIHVIITLALIGIILVQRTSGDGLSGIGGGGGGGFMTGKAQANLLTRTTAVLAVCFIVNCLVLSWLTQQNAPSRSIADKIAEQEAKQVDVPSPDALDAPDSAQPANPPVEPTPTPAPTPAPAPQQPSQTK